MTKQEMLTELIELAWKSEATLGELTLGYYLFEDSKNRIWACWSDDSEPESLASANDILFNHDFAKAIFGFERVDVYGNTFAEFTKNIDAGMHYPINYKWLSVDIRYGYFLKHLAVTNEEDRIEYAYKNRKLEE